jgi:hypothetical protein
MTAPETVQVMTALPRRAGRVSLDDAGLAWRLWPPARDKKIKRRRRAD